MAVIRDGRVLRDAGLLSSCTAVTHQRQVRSDPSELHEGPPRRLAGQTNQSCNLIAVHPQREYLALPGAGRLVPDPEGMNGGLPNLCPSGGYGPKAGAPAGRLKGCRWISNSCSDAPSSLAPATSTSRSSGRRCSAATGTSASSKAERRAVRARPRAGARAGLRRDAEAAADVPRDRRARQRLRAARPAALPRQRLPPARLDLDRLPRHPSRGPELRRRSHCRPASVAWPRSTAGSSSSPAPPARERRRRSRRSSTTSTARGSSTSSRSRTRSRSSTPTTAASSTSARSGSTPPRSRRRSAAASARTPT